MQSSLIGKIEKARRYVEEKDRMTFSAFTVEFRGDHDRHTISYNNERWRCTCNFFGTWRICSHTMAIQKILSEMIPDGTLSTELSEPVGALA